MRAVARFVPPCLPVTSRHPPMYAWGTNFQVPPPQSPGPYGEPCLTLQVNFSSNVPLHDLIVYAKNLAK